ncbi:hypothetical protein M422DRAFT_266623 [Sphaerobolus stellatus SS14]|uniref:DDE Tnp4 domain-containing protein n=1 Tax=Sphaerobolus stellatus (strain SS14) TaxID=990650 RepID=A0A0C9V2G0_SPHS4|nr:hypothetical protein M422DRAFT_266623 [Sphaerobolus stellatus SS14]
MAALEDLLRFNPTRLTREKLASFAQSIAAKGSPLDCIAAIIDGTLQKNARPHILISPDGLITHVYGLVDGHRHDETVFKESGLAALLEKHFWTPDNRPLFIYGDPAYSVSAHVMAPFKGPIITHQKKAFNSVMSKIREPPEGFIEPMWPFLSCVPSLLQCSYHPPSSTDPSEFGCTPPSLEEYFAGGPIEDLELDNWCLDSVWEEVEVRDDAEDEMEAEE